MPGKRISGKPVLCLLTLGLLALSGFSGRVAAEPPDCRKSAPEAGSADASAYHNAAWNPAGVQGRKKLYLFTADFPSDPLIQYPIPATEETRFWRLLDKEMSATESLSLTADPRKADYRVELQCGGVFRCSRLLVNVKSPDRTVLTSFSLDKINRRGGLGAPYLEQVSRELTQRLDERLRLLPQGGYGHFE
jgi:hypothetical protein